MSEQHGHTTAAPPPVSDPVRLSGEHPEICIPLKEYFEALRAGDEKVRAADIRFAAERDLRYREVSAERDQRYAEVKAAEEKALKVKETADLKALDLASQIQTYKDEKANALREQIASERGLYATREDLAGALREIQATIKPLTEGASQSAGAAGNRTERRLDTGQIIAIIAVIALVATLIIPHLK